LQACIINELAKKVFDILKKNPKKFEMEYSEAREKQVELIKVGIQET